MFQSRSSGNGPIADTQGIAHKRCPRGFQGLGDIIGFDDRILALLGDTPCRGAIGDESIGEQNDGRHVLNSQAGRLERHLKAVGRRSGGKHHQRALATASIQRLIQVGLFRFCGQACRGAATLHVNEHEGQFGHHCQSQSLALKSQTWAGCRRHGQMSCKCCADSRTDATNLILHLYGFHAEVATLGQFVQDVGGRSDRIRAQEQRTPAHLRSHDQSPRRCLVAANVGIGARADIIALDAVGRNGGVDVVTVIVSPLDNKFVGLIDLGLVGKLSLEELQRRLHGTVEQPAYKSQCKHVAALELRLQIHTRVLESLLDHCGDGCLDDLGPEVQFLIRITGGVQCLVQTCLGKGIDIDNRGTALAQELRVLLERGRIHGHQNIAFVTRRVHAMSDVNLETRNATQRALRGPHLGGIVREGGDAVAESGAHIREDVASQLHAIAAVAREAHHDTLPELDFSFFCHFKLIKYLSMIEFRLQKYNYFLD